MQLPHILPCLAKTPVSAILVKNETTFYGFYRAAWSADMA